MAVQAIASGLDDLRFRGQRLNAEVSGAIVGDTPIKRTIASASRITLSLNDPNAKLVRDPFFKQRTRASIDDLKFTLAQVKWADGSTTAVLEDSSISDLKQHRGPRKFVRGEYTRAQAIAELFKTAGVRLVSPEKNIEQPISRGRSKTETRKKVDEERGQGVDRTANLTVKGTKASPKQIDIADQVLRSTYTQFPKAPHRAVVALLCAVTHESVMGTAGMETPEDGSSIGILQALTSNIPIEDAKDIDYNVRRFMAEPWTGTSLGGAIKQAKAGASVGTICTTIQGNSTGDVFTQWIDEAEKWIDAFGGGSASFEVTSKVPYEFEVKKDETYWEAAKRWAKEVRWRLFISNGIGYYMTDAKLLASRPRLRIKSDFDGVDTLNYPPGIDSVTYDVTPAKAANSAVVVGRAARWGAPPGSVVIFDEDMGAGEGRWLVASIETSLTNPDATIKLTRPSKPLPEPPAETKTRTVKGEEGAAPGANSTGADAARAVAWAKKVLGTNEGSPKYRHWMDTMGRPDEYWCSDWIAFLMQEVMGFNLSNVSGTFPSSICWASWDRAKQVSESQIKPGDIVMYSGDHVALYVGGGQVIGGNQSDSVTYAGLHDHPSPLSNVARPPYR